MNRWLILIFGILLGSAVGFYLGFRSSISILNHTSKYIHEADSNLGENIRIWSVEGYAPDVYAQAAYSIIQELPKKRIYPTPGNVIALLGQPSGGSINGYQGGATPPPTSHVAIQRR